MKRSLIIVFSLILLIQSSTAFSEEPRYALQSGESSDAQATYLDIKTTLGIVPTFLRDYPQTSITGAWQEMKAVQLSDSTALTPKNKELIALGVAAQIPCTYCVKFHSEAAKFNGAAADELKEAVAVASMTRHWSTFLNGSEADEAEFRSDVDRMMKKFSSEKQSKSKPNVSTKATAEKIETVAQALKDIEKTFGFVPTFLKEFPDAGLVGAWNDLKSLELSSDTVISPKIKSLIALSVASQIPCSYCVYFDTQAAKLEGASEQEIQEAIVMASITRKWSTVLNGLQIDPASFNRELTAIMSHLKKQNKKN